MAEPVNTPKTEPTLNDSARALMAGTGEASAVEKLFPVKLLKNYVPMNTFEVVGHDSPALVRKDAAGRHIIVREAAFVDGQTAPPPYPGVGFERKIWAKTVIKLPLEEAKRLVGLRLAERADALPG